MRNIRSCYDQRMNKVAGNVATLLHKSFFQSGDIGFSYLLYSYKNFKYLKLK